MKQVNYVAVNHNGRPLCDPLAYGAAQKEANTYRWATGNEASVIPEADVDTETFPPITKEN